MPPPTGGRRGPRPDEVRLARALSQLGVATRTHAERLIVAGRVCVAGRVVTDPDRFVVLGREPIEVDGVAVRRAETVWLAMHKPVGFVTTLADELGRPTVRDLLADAPVAHVVPVGRLDLDSSGLLLWTNDTRGAARITAPGSPCAKVYAVDVEPAASRADLAAFAGGMRLDDEPEPLLPVRAERDPDTPGRLVLTLHEGRNRQIRRMCAARGLTVRALHRIAIGPIRLGDLPVGASRALDAAERAALAAALGAPEPPSRRDRRPRRAS